MRRRGDWLPGLALLVTWAIIVARPDTTTFAAEDPLPQDRGAGALGQGLASLPLLSTARTRSVCAENPTGGKGRGGMAVPDPTEKEYPASGRAADDLGQGWKVRPFLRVNRGQTATLMEVTGPGVIQHIWMKKMKKKKKKKKKKREKKQKKKEKKKGM